MFFSEKGPRSSFANQVSWIFIQNQDWKKALDKTAQVVRTTLLFDHIVVYLMEPDGHMDVAYAKATGRGKRAEADVTWGETAASKVFETKQPLIETPSNPKSQDRLTQPYILGLPLSAKNAIAGSMVFVRFGGPEFTKKDIRNAKNLAYITSIFIEREKLVEVHGQLDRHYKQIQLKEDFINAISHELRSPLGFIKGYTTTLLRSDTTWDPATQKEFLQIIDQETDYLQELIENLLDSTRLSSGQMKMTLQPIRLDALLNNVIQRVKQRLPEQVIELSGTSETKVIQGDSRRLAQVFENLLSNAAKYAPNSKVNISVVQDEEETHIAFQDFGPGISEEYLPHIFEKFFRNPELSPNVHGSGLGLSICKQIIRSHQGSINIQSKLGEGTTFHITIPNTIQNFSLANDKEVPV